MTLVKLFGGARKSFSCSEISIDADSITIAQLLDRLVRAKQDGTPELDTANILVAVNGADSSALDGRDTVIRQDDVVSIIPVIHGGAAEPDAPQTSALKPAGTRFEIEQMQVALLGVTGNTEFGSAYIDELRARHPRLTIQGVSSRYILGASHAQKIIHLSLQAQRRGILLARRLEADMLMRFACTTQIARAIERAGISAGNDFALVALGTAADLDALGAELEPFLQEEPFPQDDPGFLRKEFGITDDCLGAVLSKTPLEDILTERAATLF